MQKPKVLITVLASSRKLQVCTTKTLIVMATDPRVVTEFVFIQKVPVDEARNSAVDYFLKGDCDYMISLDEDVGSEHNPIDLVFLGKDVIFLPTPIIQGGEKKWNVHFLNDIFINERLCEVSKGGTGCFVLSKKAAETIEKPLFNFKYDKNGRLELGEDYYFSEKAAKHFTLYAHRDYPCSHIKYLDLL